jgi:hypothetical protein
MMVRILSVGLFLVFLTGCDHGLPLEHMSNQFGDQHFKTAIALVELHNIRYGEYPETISDLRFTGDWDPIALQSVEYERVPEGYRLKIKRGIGIKHDVEYPDEFWQGLGIVRSNQSQANATH